MSDRLTLIVGALCRAIAAHAGRHRTSAPLVLLLWPYLHRVAARLHALTAALQGGRLPASRTRTPATRAPSLRPPRLPGGFAWLLRLAPETASFGSQLRHLLTDPDMAALVDAEPRVARILRPLCRMLGIEPGPDLPPALFTHHRRPASPTRPPAERPLPRSRADARAPDASSFGSPIPA